MDQHRRVAALSRHLLSASAPASPPPPPTPRCRPACLPAVPPPARLYCSPLSSSAPAATALRVAAALDAHGFCILEGFLATREVTSLRRTFDRDLLPATPLGRNGFEGARTRRCYSLFNKTRALDALATHPMLLAVLERVLDSEHFLLSSTVGISIGPGEKNQPLHRDDGKYPVARPHPELVCNIILAVDDFTEENGGTVLYPGSHVWQYDGENDFAVKHVLPNQMEAPVEAARGGARKIPQLRSDAGRNARIQCTMPAGSIMIYRGSLLHGGGANRSPSPRLGVLLEFVQAWLRPQENHLLGVDRDVVRKLPRKLQEMLGWTVSPPFIGYVDGRHPRRLLRENP